MKRPSLRKGINDKCKDCCYDRLDVGTWRHQVESCTATECPLWPIRPVTTRKKEGAT